MKIDLNIALKLKLESGATLSPDEIQKRIINGEAISKTIIEGERPEDRLTTTELEDYGLFIDYENLIWIEQNKDVEAIGPEDDFDEDAYLNS